MRMYSDRQRVEAAEWFIDVVEADDPSPELLQRWTRWLDAEEGNRLAFEAVERAWHQVPEDAELARDLPVAPRDRQRWSTPLTYAAAAAVVLAGVGWLLARQDVTAYPASGEFSTRTGEHMDLTLADGSRVTLGARSRLAVDISASGRELHLLAGEAFFVVHKDPGRPFTVSAKGGEITAIGTAFNVRTMGDRVTVAVTEGAVAVEGLSAPLSPGDQVTYSRAAPAGAAPFAGIVRVDPAQPARWRTGWLMYRDEPLRDVIADVGRYADRGIALEASVPPDLRFTGAVFRDSVVEWVRALPDAFPLVVLDGADGALHVTGGASSGSSSPAALPVSKEPAS